MTIERKVRLISSTFVLLSILLAFIVDAFWIFLAVFVAIMLIQSAFTGFCPMEWGLKKLEKTEKK